MTRNQNLNRQQDRNTMDKSVDVLANINKRADEKAKK